MIECTRQQAYFLAWDNSNFLHVPKYEDNRESNLTCSPSAREKIHAHSESQLQSLCADGNPTCSTPITACHKQQVCNAQSLVSSSTDLGQYPVTAWPSGPRNHTEAKVVQLALKCRKICMRKVPRNCCMHECSRVVNRQEPCKMWNAQGSQWRTAACM